MERDCRKRVFVFCLMVLLAFAGSLTGKQTAEAASLNKTKATLIQGETLQLKVSGTTKKISWSSSKKSVASVSSTGKITARGKGAAVITAKAGSQRFTCKVTVEVPVISKKTASVFVGKTLQLKLTGTTQKVKWSSSDTTVARVSSSGKVSGKKAGKATITAKVGTKKYTCKVTVKKNKLSDRPVTALKLNTNKVSMNKGGETELKVSVSPSNATNKEIAWSSSDTSIATVSSAGIVKGIRKGTATITAAAKDGSQKKATCKVSVTEEVVDNVVGEVHTLLPGSARTGGPCVGVLFTNNTSQDIRIDWTASCINMEQIYIKKDIVNNWEAFFIYAEGYENLSYSEWCDMQENNNSVTLKAGESRNMLFKAKYSSHIYYDFTPYSYILFEVYDAKQTYVYKLDMADSWNKYIEYTGYHSTYDYRDDREQNLIPDKSDIPISDVNLKKIKIKEKCIFCHGTGKCGSCNGTGKLSHVTNLPNTCHACNSGKCGYCGGKGYTYEYDYVLS
ncbi:MAG: Ig-like domain-containing protein [Candidatus Limivivens sp.]|nr:Ig-like domain-containing protein [Candidatus Limivivens sp.]